MKTIKFLPLALIVLMGFTSCSDDDAPEIINEEEVVTTMVVTLVPQTGSTVTLTSRDLDGDGPQEPEITVSGPLAVGMSYSGKVVLSNETETPAEIINGEIEEEADEHQFFYQAGSSLNVTTQYADTEADYQATGGTNPVGIEFTLQAGAASSGNFTVTLRHEPAKDAEGVSEGNIANAGGETDFVATFSLTIQ